MCHKSHFSLALSWPPAPLRSAPHRHTECGGMCPSLTLRTPAFLSTSVSHAVSRNRAAPPPPPTPFRPPGLGVIYGCAPIQPSLATVHNGLDSLTSGLALKVRDPNYSGLRDVVRADLHAEHCDTLSTSCQQVVLDWKLSVPVFKYALPPSALKFLSNTN